MARTKVRFFSHICLSQHRLPLRALVALLQRAQHVLRHRPLSAPLPFLLSAPRLIMSFFFFSESSFSLIFNNGSVYDSTRWVHPPVVTGVVASFLGNNATMPPPPDTPPRPPNSNAILV